jgi:hypothetical protein
MEQIALEIIIVYCLLFSQAFVSYKLLASHRTPKNPACPMT